MTELNFLPLISDRLSTATTTSPSHSLLSFVKGRRRKSQPVSIRMEQFSRQKNPKDKVVVILGATGTGKSRLSIDLATRFPSEIINSDKIQVYKGLAITMNQITLRERRGVPHHHLGQLSFEDGELTAADFRSAASNHTETMVSNFKHRNNSASEQISSEVRMMKKIVRSSIVCFIICGILAVYQSFLDPNPMKKTSTVTPLVNHQVFINFRGDQLRHNFVDHLTYAFKTHNIKFFIDKDELLGKDLQNLFVRIEESTIALAIFSTMYPESKWCMNELVKLKKRSDEGKLQVIPIFYKVDARDVRRPTRESEFGKNFWRLMETSNPPRDPIQEWREAVECISNKTGLSLGDKSSEADFIQVIVKKVQRVIEAMRLEKE